jgi:3-isopropylmalate dehydratase small subunit
LGPHCLEHTHPQFYSRAKEGYNIVVAGNAFGCGSSRENAVGALLGCGVVCVIAKSFAFIYARNQPNLGLLGIVISDDSFYDAAKDGVEVMVDLDRCMVGVQGVEKEWGFQLGPMERELIEVGGLNSAFKKFGKTLFNVMCAPKGSVKSLSQKDESCGTVGELQW